VSPHTFPILAPANPLAGAAGFRPPAPPAMAKGHIAKGQIFSGVCPQNCNFNSKVPLLILVKFVENRTKIRKMQSQFCWIRCEKSYNFCYSCLS
jgi:hypothetical protein